MSCLSKNCIIKSILLLFFVQLGLGLNGQRLSPARVWNEVILEAIRNDFARPTIHARNLHHTSIAMYDAFAVYDDVNRPYFLGNTIGDFTCAFDGVPKEDNLYEARTMAMSYALYRIIEHRFKNSPGAEKILLNADLVLSAFGYDKNYTETDYTNGYPAALGNYLGQQIIEFGLQDGSNEENDFANQIYESINPVIDPFSEFDIPSAVKNDDIVDPNRWQQLELQGFIDQGGNVIGAGVPPFLSPEWGFVTPFSLTEESKTVKTRDGDEYWLYHDPGDPCYIDTLNSEGLSDDYIWGFSLVAKWRTHTMHDEETVLDISPGAIGNLTDFPTTISGLREAYNFEEGGDYSTGHDINPSTGEPYPPNIVRRDEYAAILAEFWADGPDSETPPGHWFTLLNYVNDSPELVKKYKGQGEEMGDFEWDVKSYFMLGGAMHDAAISAWSAKGFYDYIRPISAIRWMIEQGQSTDPNLPNYHPNGIPLMEGVSKLILDGDPDLAPDRSNYGRISIVNFRSTFSGKDFWGNAKLWLPFQPHTFITPPFAGYVSGHSTFSRAAAEVLTLLTGDAFFPGGLGEFHIYPGELELSVGPVDTVTIQWATYRDAANQSGISRIWGGIHPPVDDIPGRIMGEKVGIQAFEKADEYFGNEISTDVFDIPEKVAEIEVYPNPVFNNRPINITSELLNDAKAQLMIIDQSGREFYRQGNISNSSYTIDNLNSILNSGIYYIKIESPKGTASSKLVILK